MSGQAAGSSRRPGREFTRIALVLLAATGCECPRPQATLCPTELERAGDQALVSGKPDEARPIFLQAMRGQQRPFLAWIGVARSSIAMGDSNTAQMALGQAMQNDPGCAASADLLGRTLLMLSQTLGEDGRGQAVMADMMFQRAERIQPDFPKLAYHRGLARLSANEPGPAAVFLERAVQADPSDTNAPRALLIAYGRTGQSDRAKALVETMRRSGRFTEPIEWEPASRPEAPASPASRD
jgi:predicted Zn-dependent protease